MTHWIKCAFILFTLSSCETKQEMKPTIVIGGGLMGSATAWQLSRQGESVILLEKQDSIYTSGSSLGDARISRSLGPKDDIYAYLQMRGIYETQLLVDFLNEKEPNVHSMGDIYTTSPVTYLFYPTGSTQIEVFNLDQPDTLANSSDDSIALAMNAEVALKKFDLRISDSIKVIREYRQHSGTLNPNALINKLHLAIKYTGNKVRYHQKVNTLKRTEAGYEVSIIDTKTQASQKIMAKRIVAAGGPYNGKLLKNIAPVIDSLINPKRLFLAFLKVNPSIYSQWTPEKRNKLISGYPIIKLHDELFYSMIERYDTDGTPILKVGGHFKRTSIDDLDKVWTIPISDSEIAWSKRETAEYLQMMGFDLSSGDFEMQSGYSCVYSLTNSEVPYVANLPSHHDSFDKNAVLVGGMSGVGAKGSMTYGLIAANLLLGKEVPDDRMYQITKSALGNERLKSDLARLK